MIKKFVPGPARILDVGCATGILLNGLKNEGWECYGVEPDTTSCKYANKRFGLDLFNGSFEDSAFPDGHFDLVTMMDVLEHVYDPKSAISEAARILKSDGGILGITPNAASLEKHIFGPYWDGWEIPRHNHIFSPDTLKKLLEENGFGEVTFFSFTGRHGNFMMSVNFWLDSLNWSVRMKSLIRGFFDSFFTRIILLPVFWVLEIFNRSTNIAFFAKKKSFE